MICIYLNYKSQILGTHQITTSERAVHTLQDISPSEDREFAH